MQWAAMMIMIVILIRYGCVSVSYRNSRTSHKAITQKETDRQTDTDRHRQTDT